MKKTLTVILMIYILSSLSFSRVAPGQTRNDEEKGKIVDFTGFFVLQEESPLRVSIDHGWEKNGWVPLFITFRDIEISLHIKSGDLETGAGLKTWINELLAEGVNLPFQVYEKNHLRTRMELSEWKPVQLKINPKGLVDIFVGGCRLKLEPNLLLAEFKEIESAPGELYQLTLVGPKVTVSREFVFMPSKGIIYAASPGSTILALNPDPGKSTDWSVWAVRIDGEEAEGERIIKESR